MKKWGKKLTAGGLACTLLFAPIAVHADSEKKEVYVFLAASLNNAMEEIVENYKEICPDVEIYCNADSSGTLQTQIQEGARCDIFFSAARKQMDALLSEDLVKEETVTDLLENKVVLIKPKDGDTEVTGFENITKAENLALAGEDVPVGQYSREIFENLGIMEEVTSMEINEGKNVSEVLAAIAEGSNEVGVVYATDAASVKDHVEIISEAPEGSLQTPVLYPVAMTEDVEASQEETEAAKAFLAYLKSEEGGAVFEDWGFSLYHAKEEKDEE